MVITTVQVSFKLATGTCDLFADSLFGMLAQTSAGKITLTSRGKSYSPSDVVDIQVEGNWWSDDPSLCPITDEMRRYLRTTSNTRGADRSYSEPYDPDYPRPTRPYKPTIYSLVSAARRAGYDLAPLYGEDQA